MTPQACPHCHKPLEGMPVYCPHCNLRLPGPAAPSRGVRRMPVRTLSSGGAERVESSPPPTRKPRTPKPALQCPACAHVVGARDKWCKWCHWPLNRPTE